MLTLTDSLGWWTRRFRRTSVARVRRPRRRRPTRSAAPRASPSAIPTPPDARPAASPGGPCRSGSPLRRSSPTTGPVGVLPTGRPAAGTTRGSARRGRGSRRARSPPRRRRTRPPGPCARSGGTARSCRPGAAGLLRLGAAGQRQVHRDPLVLVVDVQDRGAGVLELARQGEEVRGPEQVAAVEGGEPAADDAGRRRARRARRAQRDVRGQLGIGGIVCVCAPLPGVVSLRSTGDRSASRRRGPPPRPS